MIQKQKLEKTLAMSKSEFDRVAENLRARGFSEEKGKDQDAFHNGMPLGTFSRSFTGFELRVGANQRGIDLRARPPGSGGMEDFIRIDLWVTFRTAANRNILLLPIGYEKKSHFVSTLGGSPEPCYVADMAPGPDPALLIRSGLALDAAMTRVKMDMEFGNAVDYKELFDRFRSALGQISERNQFKGMAGTYLEQFLEGCSRKYEYELMRLRGDPILAGAMDAVADKG
ncbi:MAG: hypothetical protein U0R44_03630 [Candidatus Micrarchaeia archaeon]